MKYRVMYDKGTRLRVRSGQWAFTKEEGYGLASLLLENDFINEVYTSHRNGSILIYYVGVENKSKIFDILDSITLDDLFEGEPTQLQISKAILKLMRQAFNPNLVQTLEGNPALIHGGPFANIAHGCNSIIATKLGLKLAPIVVTEAGFGADLGAEKFLDIKCRVGGLKPDAVVVVATIRALKLHGGVLFEELDKENVEALKVGSANLKRHMENVAKYGIPAVICINHFASDTENETKALIEFCNENGYEYAFCDSFSRGAAGGVDLAKKVLNTLETKESHYHPLYEVELPIKAKIEKICKEIYRAKEVVYTEEAEAQIEKYNKLGYDKIPVCIAKTPLSLTDNPKILNAPDDFVITIREIRLSAGAGFVVALTGSIMTMPGLPKVPAAVKMEAE